MADFTEKIKVLIDTETAGAVAGLSGMKGKLAETEGAFGKLKTTSSGTFDAIGVAGPAALAGVGTAVAGFAVKAIGDFQNTAQEVLHFKEVAGGTAESASRWVETFNDYGVSADKAGTLVAKLAKVTETSPGSLEAYGASVIKAKDGTIDLNATLLNVIDTMHNAPDASAQAGLGAAAFGKSWQDVAKLVDVGAQGIKADFDSISGGQIFSEKDLKNSEDFRLALDNLSDSVAGLENAIGSAAIPVLTEFLTLMQEIAGAAGLVPGPLAKIAEIAAKFNPISLPYVEAKAALDALTGSTDSYVTAVGPMNAQTHQVAGSVADLKEQEKLDKAAKDDLAKSTKALNDFSEHTLKLFNDMADAALSLIDSDLAYSRAIEDTGKALVDFQTAQVAASDAVTKHGDASTEAADASGKLDSASRSLEDSMYKVAAAAAQSAQDQATAAGAAFTTSDKINAEIGALQDLKTKFPELGGAIDGYIAKLNAIPHEKTTDINADTSAATLAVNLFIQATENKTAYIDVVGRLSTQGQAHATGGSASGFALVGELGPELVSLPMGSYVYTAAQTKGMLAGMPAFADGGIVGATRGAITGGSTPAYGITPTALGKLFGPGTDFAAGGNDPLAKLFGPGADFADWVINSGKFAGWTLEEMFGPGSDFYRTGPDTLQKLFGVGTDFAKLTATRGGRLGPGSLGMGGALDPRYTTGMFGVSTQDITGRSTLNPVYHDKTGATSWTVPVTQAHPAVPDWAPYQPPSGTGFIPPSFAGGINGPVTGGGPATVIHLTVNAGIGTDGAAVGRQIVNTLVEYNQTVGPLPVAVRQRA